MDNKPVAYFIHRHFCHTHNFVVDRYVVPSVFIAVLFGCIIAILFSYVYILTVLV